MKGVNVLQKASYKSKLYLKRQSPTILTCIAAIGVVATSVIAVRATPKAMKLCEVLRLERVNDYEEEPTKLEYVLAAWQCYIPAAFIGMSTIICILGANVLNKRNQASLASAYTLLNQSYRQYREAVNSVFGEDADSRINAQIAKDAYVSADGYSTYSLDDDIESDKILCYDLYSRRYFTTTMAAVLNAQYHLNRNFSLRGDVSVNEFYEFLGISKIDYGDEIGWSGDELVEGGVMWLDFDNYQVEMEDGMKCCVISAIWSPARFTC